MPNKKRIYFYVADPPDHLVITEPVRTLLKHLKNNSMITRSQLIRLFKKDHPSMSANAKNYVSIKLKWLREHKVVRRAIEE